MKTSPFVCFVAGPTGEQHIFLKGADDERNPLSLCGKSAHEIHHDQKGKVNVSEHKNRDPKRDVCLECDRLWRVYPDSPWRAWVENAEKGMGK